MQIRNTNTRGWADRLISISFMALVAVALQGCQDGVSTESQPVTNVTASTYSGPAARTSDIQGFRINLWEPLRAQNRCGSCHNTGGQAPSFVREDDVNLAYEAVNAHINRDQPDESSLVTKMTKVAKGHNCWLASDSACAAIITNYIEAWVGTGVSTGREIELEPPVDHVVGETRTFPDDSTLFVSSNLHYLLTTYCSNCHIESATSPQSPYFADPNSDVAYAAVKNAIDLETPPNSQLVRRLLEFHNCWDDCPSNAEAMQKAIEFMQRGIDPTPIDPALVVSRALALPEGIVASGGSRHETDAIALYEFKTGSGNIAYDTSGVDPAINLTLSGNTAWVEGWGVEFTAGSKAQGTTGDSSKLAQLIQATGEYSIEAWVVPANVTQEGPARIVSYSASTDVRNFTLGQTMYNYDFMHRSSTTDANGEPAHHTADADEDLQATEQHVIVTFDPANGRRIYINGVFTDDMDETAPGSLNDWDDSYALVLGNETSSDRQWSGKIRLLAIHNRALTEAQIQQNFAAGVGEKYFLLFNVTDLVGLPLSYVMFEVSQFDNYSYLFRDPRFISLDESVTPGFIPIKGMRIGINGKESAIGQAYTRIDTAIEDNKYTANGQSLHNIDVDRMIETGKEPHNIGTTIPLEKGADSDIFFLTFERLGSHNNVYSEPAIPLPAVPADRDPASLVGLRTFEEISASMSALTGVPRTNSSVASTYGTIKQQLPSAEDINGFLSSHQVAVSQLAIEYCSELVDNASLRSAFFPGFDFSINANSIADNTWQDQVVNPIIDKFLGQNLTTQPLPADVRAELMLLVTDTADLKPYDNDGVSHPDGTPDGLARCGGACSSDRTYTVTKAACASVLGSAALLLQ